MMAADTNSKPCGVYKNPRLMHACTSIVGYTVHLQTKEGTVWEGIFNTFSPDFTICLHLAIEIDPEHNNKDCLYAALKAGKKAKEQAFFDLKDIVRISAVDVDLNYATNELAKLTTDADISGYDANKSAEHRQLESWQDDDCENTNSESLMSLDDTLASGKKNDSRNSSRGWDAQDMFRYNERVHKVTTTYDEKLTEYTLPLQKHVNTKEWRKKQERATAIAKEIESNTRSQSRLAKEDEGDCEEEKFSAVIRPIPQTPPTSRPPVQSDARLQSDNKFYNVDAPEGGKQNQHQQPQQQSHQQSQPNQGQQQSQQQQSQSNQRHQPMHQHHQQNSRTFRPRPQDRSQVESLKNFGKLLNLGPSNTGTVTGSSPASGVNNTSSTASGHTSSTAANTATSISPNSNSSASGATSSGNEGTSSGIGTTGSGSMTSPGSGSASGTGSSEPSTSKNGSTTSTNTGVSTTKDQSELARKSKLNPNAKEFVYKPRSPAVNQGATLSGPNQSSNNGVNQAANGGPNHAANGAMIDPNNSSPMIQATHAPYYQQVTMFPHGLSPHQQQHHAQFMPNHPHPHFQNQIHYMSTIPPQFAQQMPRGYIRGNFQNYHHRGEHHGNVRADYSQASMMAPTSAGQPFVPPPSGAPHPMNVYPASPQQPMIYSGPPQSMYPVVQAGFPQHMPHMMPNPPPYDGSTVYMPPQNYIVNP